MKLSVLSLVFVAAALACGDSSSGNDAGGGDASNDSASSDATVGDSGSDAGASDAASDAKGDGGGLDAGSGCDLQNDQCGPGLKCCGGGAQLDDAGQGHCIVPTDAGTCPLIP